MADETEVFQAVPTKVTVEIANRFRTTSRRSQAVRVHLTYRLEESPKVVWEEADLARVIRLSVRTTLQVYRLAQNPPKPRPGASPSVVLAEVPSVNLGGDRADSLADMLGLRRETEALSDSTAIVLNREDDTGSDTPFHFHPVAEKEDIKPRKLSKTQHRTLEVMARQLNLEGHSLADLLGLHSNKASLDDLTYREAASLIAYFSDLLRKRLLKEKEATTAKASTQGNKSYSDG